VKGGGRFSKAGIWEDEFCSVYFFPIEKEYLEENPGTDTITFFHLIIGAMDFPLLISFFNVCFTDINRGRAELTSFDTLGKLPKRIAMRCIAEHIISSELVK
jgi:hypothetical protein